MTICCNIISFFRYTVEGRVNVEVETDEFVEILTDKPHNYEKNC